MSAAVLPAVPSATSTAVRPLRVALVGPIPPPYGGVAVHVQRLQHALAALSIETVVIPDLHSAGSAGAGSIRWFASLARAVDIVHYHTFETQYPTWRRFAALRLLGVPVVVTLHSFRDNEPTTRTARFRLLAGLGLRGLSHVICVGSDIRDAVLQLGVKPSRVTVIAPYLPPAISAEVRAAIPDYVDRFLVTHSPVITANAFAIKSYAGEDLYGLDLCIELCRALAAEYPDVGFVFAYSDVGDAAHLDAMRARIRDYGLEERFLLASRPGEYWPILERSTVFVRPTNTDSYGISVAEALYFGIPAIASDVCERPTGTILFRSRDTTDLIAKTRQALRIAAYNRDSLHAPQVSGHAADRIADIYAAVSGQIRTRKGDLHRSAR